MRFRIFISLFLFVLAFPFFVFAQEMPSITPQEKLEAVVDREISQKEEIIFDRKQIVQELELTFTSGSKNKQKIIIKNGDLPSLQQYIYKPGDKVVVTLSKNLDAEDVLYISDYVRRSSLYYLAGIFIVLTILIGGLKGFYSLIGLGFSFAVIFIYILPKILSGASPIQTAIIGSLIVLPVNFLLSHGVNKKTFTALISTFIALCFTGILAVYFVDNAYLSGYVSDEVTFLQVVKQGQLNVQGLLLAGIIISILGILDDVTVSQASSVFELKKASPDLKFLKLYRMSMNIGKDHIASVVNTLVLVYAGASLPLLLLFINNPMPYEQIINYEIIAEEVIKILVTSIGLIAAIPLTTLLASWAASHNFKVVK